MQYQENDILNSRCRNKQKLNTPLKDRILPFVVWFLLNNQTAKKHLLRYNFILLYNKIKFSRYFLQDTISMKFQAFQGFFDIFDKISLNVCFWAVKPIFYSNFADFHHSITFNYMAARKERLTIMKKCGNIRAVHC